MSCIYKTFQTNVDKPNHFSDNWINRVIFLPDVATTLWGFGEAYLNWNEPAQALPLLQEAAALFAPLAHNAPNVFDDKHDAVLQLLEIAQAA